MANFKLNLLKPMDSFGMWWKSNEIIFLHWNLNHNFIVLYELLMPCQLFAQKCSNCQEITEIWKCSNTLPLVMYIGISCYWVYYITTCHSKQLLVGLMVLSDGIVHFLKFKKMFNKSTKTILWPKYSFGKWLGGKHYDGFLFILMWFFFCLKPWIFWEIWKKKNGMPPRILQWSIRLHFIYIAPSSDHSLLIPNLPFKLIKLIKIHQIYTTCTCM